MRITDGERSTLAAIGKRLGKQTLAEVASVVTPGTLLTWHRKLIARKFDGSTYRRYPGRPRIDPAIEPLIIQFAQENRTWGYDRIVGALKRVGYTVSDQTVANILKRHNLPLHQNEKRRRPGASFFALIGTSWPLRTSLPRQCGREVGW